MQIVAQPTYQFDLNNFRMRPLLPKVNPDNNALFNFRSQTSMPQEDAQRRIVRTNDMGEQIDLIRKGYRRFNVSLTFQAIYDDKLSKITEFYYNPDKGAEGLKTFKWEHPTEKVPGTDTPQLYVAQFDISGNRSLTATIFSGVRKDVRNIDIVVVGWCD